MGENSMIEAMKAVKENKIGINRAGLEYDVPKMTLKNVKHMERNQKIRVEYTNEMDAQPVLGLKRMDCLCVKSVA